VCFVFIKHKTAYYVRNSDWSSDVCSSDLLDPRILPVENLCTKAESASQEVACRHGLRFHDREAPETRLRVILRVGKQITAVRDFGQFNLCPVNWVENVTGCGELRQRRLKHGKAEDVDLRVQEIGRAHV